MVKLNPCSCSYLWSGAGPGFSQWSRADSPPHPVGPYPGRRAEGEEVREGSAKIEDQPPFADEDAMTKIEFLNECRSRRRGTIEEV
ncbi:hypothetical protein Q8A67_024188 [Cirrhinus molitorella]|uniref:Uncharacterized protein n=1 Tax=Cirrhinus molitorella TaxID=172907 RepID=A0AA88NY36_9TELE|nr:hypothetical protein Q8A67_024188 [Cirrhinus molitorella]